MPFQIKPRYVFLTITVLGIVLHWNVWQSDIMGIHAWRQTQTMTVVENFAFEDMNILNPRINARGDGDSIYRMEFPLMQWVFAWFYTWFGANLALVRSLSFLIYLFSVFGFYRLLNQYHLPRLTTAIGAWCFAWSPVLFYYAVNPLPDNLALCFGIWSLAFLKKHQQENSVKSLIAFAGLLMLATAIKLPFIVFGAGYVPLFFQNLKGRKLKIGFTNAVIVLLAMLPALAWYAWVIPQWTNAALIGGVGAEQTFDYRSAADNIWGVIHSLVPELFVNYGSVLFLLIGMVVFVQSASRFSKYASEILVLFFVLIYYLYEVNMIGLAHDYYFFPFLPILFLVITAGVQRVLLNHQAWLRYVGLIGLIILPLTAYLRTANRWSPMGNEGPLLAHKDELRGLIPDDALVVVGNDPSSFIYLYHLGKKGWAFEQNWITAEQLNDQINRGAEYLVSNTEFVKEDTSISQFLEEPIFDKDGITVYPLKRISDS